MIERQVFVTWYTPEEKLPPEGEITIATISGSAECIEYDHCFALVEWRRDDGWVLTDSDANDAMDELVVHAWCDLKPYGADEAMRRYKPT